MFNSNLISSMKKVFFVIALCASVMLANAQDQKVEKTTKTTTKTVEKTTTAAIPGKTVIKEAELLQPIKDNIAKDYTGAKVIHAIKNEVKGVVTYEVIVVNADKTKLTLVYDKDGKFIKKEEGKKPAVKTEVKKEVKTTTTTETPKK